MTVLLATFPNQDKYLPRIFSLAAFDLNCGLGRELPRWVRSGATKYDLGVSGVVQVGNWLYCLIQSKVKPRLTSIDLRTWQVLHTYVCNYVIDPHSIIERNGSLFVVSSGTNAVIRFEVDNGHVISEQLHWRPDCVSSDCDEIHLNSLACIDGRIVVSHFGGRDSSGEWLHEGLVYDTERDKVIVDDLAHPHSLTQHQGHLYLADSFNGQVLIGKPNDNDGYTFDKVNVGGYPRGLVVDGGDLLVAISARRLVSKSTGKVNIAPKREATRSGIVRINLETRQTAKCIDLQDYGSELYDLHIVSAPLPDPSSAPSRLPVVEALRSWRECQSR